MFVFVVVVGVAGGVVNFVAVVDIFINVVFVDVFVVGCMGDVASVVGIIEEAVVDVLLLDTLLDDDCVVVDGGRMVVGIVAIVVAVGVVVGFNVGDAELVTGSAVVVFADSVVTAGTE